MRIALCNEVLAPMVFERQCVFAAALGYDGLEIAPYTLAETPQALDASQRTGIRRAAADAGIAISSLHWLLAKPGGLSITSPDAAVRARTIAHMHRQIDLCADLGGSVLVHGSPAQRRIDDADPVSGRQRGIDAFAAVADHAADVGVIYCIEALAPPAANFILSVAQAVEIVEAVKQPALRTMLDCCAAANAEAESIPALLARWLPTGMLVHVQVNDANHLGPGQGAVRFADILRTLRQHAYAGWIAVEPFDYQPDGPACAARAIGYLRGLLEALEPTPGS
ncbi:MAG: sugar phosphate isomerase/epimerase family protein [Burkholderiaceae bacterium]